MRGLALVLSVTALLVGMSPDKSRDDQPQDDASFVEQPALPVETETRGPTPECQCDDCTCGDDCTCSQAEPVKESLTVEPAKPQPLPQPVAPEPSKPLVIDPVTGIAVGGPGIIQLSTDGCQPCIAWLQQEAPKYSRQGWQVSGPVYGVSAPVYPSFRVFDGQRWHSHAGWMSGADVRRMIGR